MACNFERLFGCKLRTDGQILTHQHFRDCDGIDKNERSSSGSFKYLMQSKNGNGSIKMTHDAVIDTTKSDRILFVAPDTNIDMQKRLMISGQIYRIEDIFDQYDGQTILYKKIYIVIWNKDV